MIIAIKVRLDALVEVAVRLIVPEFSVDRSELDCWDLVHFAVLVVAAVYPLVSMVAVYSMAAMALF